MSRVSTGTLHSPGRSVTKPRVVAGRAIRIGRVWIVTIALLPSPVNAQPPDDASKPDVNAALVQPSVEDEVLQNILTQPIGDHTLADFDLPESFLRRFADRIIRDSYRRHMHHVEGAARNAHVAEEKQPADELPPPPSRPMKLEPFEFSLAHDLLATWRKLEPQRPDLRGFRFDPSREGLIDWPMTPPSDAKLKDVADNVAKHLAKDGLLTTTHKACVNLDASRFVDCDESDLALLRWVGIPVDLLNHFQVKGEKADACAVVSKLSTIAFSGADLALKPPDPGMTFDFTSSCPGFRVVAQDSTQSIGMFRVQVTSDTPSGTSGDTLDVTRTLLDALPHVWAVITVSHEHREGFQKTLAQWRISRSAAIEIVSTPLPVSQWAQDNGVGGIDLTDDGPAHLVTLVPRYASRREDGSEFIPGESLALSALSAAGHRVTSSPLLFQGGDLLAVVHPRTRERILFIGEAEIYRNTALGLSTPQVMEAFRIEMGIDRCVVLPSISFHLDYDVCFRAHGGELLAFINDDQAAAKIIIQLGIAALRRHESLTQEIAERALAALEQGNARALMESLGPILAKASIAPGRYRTSFAENFSTRPADSPHANLQRFLVSLDVFLAHHLGAAPTSNDRIGAAYIRSLKRRALDRQELHKILIAEGCRVVPIPSLAEADRSINYINGVHTPEAYLMPVYGGFYAPLDDAVAQAFTSVLGPGVRIIRIPTATTQQRNGAVHCAVSTYPALEPALSPAQEKAVEQD